MKIASVKMAGFRGVRGEVSLPMASGFVVVSGRNGSGKSTICDAVEFALTGHIRGASEHTEKRESISDYIWCRGEISAQSRYVELTLSNDEGTSYVIRRTPTNCKVTPTVTIEELLCHNAVSLDVPLDQLCRTAILRDEEITRLSVDLKESDRFEFVRGALGTADFTAVEKKAKEVQDVLGREIQVADVKYSNAKARVSELTTRLSQARTEASKAADVASAEHTLRTMLGGLHDDTESLIAISESRVANLRLRLDTISRLSQKVEVFQSRHSRQNDPELEVLQFTLAATLETAKTTIAFDESELESINADLVSAQAENPRIASFAELREHGSRLGMIDGCCPLCGTSHSMAEFLAKLAEIEKLVSESNARLSELTRRSVDVSEKLSRSRAEVSKLELQIDSGNAAREQWRRNKEQIEQEASGLKIALALDDTQQSLERIAAENESLNNEVLAFERSLAVLQSSLAVERMRTLEHDLQNAKDEQGTTDKQLTRIRNALNEVKEAHGTIRRVRGEYVDEQLAQLEPLMMELYHRLRPHVDWPDVRYRLRGDVRRMLSLEVGDGLNPSFVFSSGQRRAAGLAFLLAVHLSRSWCSLQTLILDDPVQHIDDFRALHLTEVLAAIRTTGRQVICTVEDESLGRLLSRRLRSGLDGSGVFVKMAYTSRDGVLVESVTTIQPLRQHVLVPA